ncbi:MAG TPA: hypothetical protein VFM05_11435 [Candidatus Saccharimonadales bacterium]|nr:hypothetical protein [Candidatus Saccharimonadales bacterium]
MQKLMLPLIFLLVIIGCSQLSDLPNTADSAFALRDVPRSGNTMMESVVARTTLTDAQKAAEYALLSNHFDPRPETWTKDRRCGKYSTSWNEWAMWGCFYFQPTNDDQIRSRIIVKSWNNFGVRTGQPWHLNLANAYQNRLRSTESNRQARRNSDGDTAPYPYHAHIREYTLSDTEVR